MRSTLHIAAAFLSMLMTYGITVFIAFNLSEPVPVYPRTIAGPAAVNAAYWQAFEDANGSTADGDSIIFPVLVIGPDGYIKPVTLNSTNGPAVDSIFVEFFNISWDGSDNPSGESKGRYRINGGAWTEINNDTASCIYENERNSGCVSITGTIHVNLPASGVQTGANTVEFQWNNDPNIMAANHSHGYRVYDLAWVESDGDEQRDYVWVEEDPREWEAPPGSDPAAGMAFVLDSVNLVRPGFDDQTACIDCHSWKGSEFVWPMVDLMLFHMEPITTRQVVLDARPADSSQAWYQQVADNVVAYQLTLNDSLNARGFTQAFTDAGYTNYHLMRPKTTMYVGCPVPVTDIDALPVEFWSASGGYLTDWGHDCLVHSDAEIQASMFADTGGQISWKSASVHVDSVANHRRIATNIQHPAWKDWLPRNNPKAIWDGESGRPDFVSHSFYTHWSTTLPSVIQGGNAQSIESAMNQFWTLGKDFNDLDLSDDGNFDPTVSTGPAAHLSIAQWQVSQTFGFYFFDKLEELAPTAYPPGSNARTPQFRSWLGSTSRVVFDVAPHIADGGGDVSIYGPDGLFRDAYYDNIWYLFQCLNMNSGNGNGAAFRPCDWKYAYGHLTGLEKNRPGMSVAFQFAKLYATAMQNGSNHGPEDEWMVRHLNISQMFAAIGGRKFPFNNMVDTTRTQLIEALVRSQMHFLMQYDTDDWNCIDSEGASGGSAWECPTSSLTMGGTVNGGEFGGLPDDFNQFRPDEAYYRALPILEHFNVAPTLIDTVVQFMDKYGYAPAGGQPSLDQWRLSAPASAPVLQSPANGATSVPVAPSVSWLPVATANGYDVQVDDDSDFSSLVLDGTTTSLSVPFSGDYSTTYYWRVRAWNASGDSPWTATRSFTTVDQPSAFIEHDFAAGGARAELGGGRESITGQGRTGTMPADGIITGFGSFADMVDGDTVTVKIDSLSGTSESIYKTAALMAITDIDSLAQFMSVELVTNRIRLVSRETTGSAPVWQETLAYLADPTDVCLRITRSGTDFSGAYRQGGGTCTDTTGYVPFETGAITLPAAGDTVKVGMFVSGASITGTDTGIAYTEDFTIEHGMTVDPPEGCVASGSDMYPMDRTDLYDAGDCYNAGSGEGLPYTWADQTGDKDQPTGSVIVGTGYSNATQIFTVFESLYDGAIAPTFIDCAAGSNAIENWIGANSTTLFNSCISAIETAGFTAADVGMTINQVANQLEYPAFPDPGSGVYTLPGQLATFGELLEGYFPNAVHTYTPGEPAHWVADSKCPRICEPIRYEVAFGINLFLEDIDPVDLDPDKHLRGAYLWSGEGVPNASGVEFFCDDFLSEGAGCPVEANQHPDASGREKAAGIYYDFLVDNYPSWINP